MSSLPKLTLPVHSITLPITKEKIEIKPFVIKQEKSLLTSLNSENRDEAIKLFKMLIEDCVVTENFDVKKLNIVDFYYLILHIRMKSTGEMINGQQKCKKCEKKTEFEINLEDSILIKNKENISKTVKINDELSLRLIPANINSLFETKDDEEISIIDLVASSIDTVIINDKIYKGFSIESLKENIFCIFTKMDYDKISEGMEILARLFISFDFLCIHCGEKNHYETDDVANFN